MSKEVKIWIGVNVQSGAEENRRTLKGLCDTLELPYGTVKRRSGGDNSEIQVYVRKKDNMVFRVKRGILV
jgi:hypothetical protein